MIKIINSSPTVIYIPMSSTYFVFSPKFSKTVQREWRPLFKVILSILHYRAILIFIHLINSVNRLANRKTLDLITSLIAIFVDVDATSFQVTLRVLHRVSAILSSQDCMQDLFCEP